MKQLRRVEITAFRRRVLITSDGLQRQHLQDEVLIVVGNPDETIAAGSDQGRKIIAETVRLLEEKLKEFAQTIETTAGTDEPT